MVCTGLLMPVAAGAAETVAPAYSRGAAGDAAHLHFAHLNGVRLAYRVEGAGVPVVFVHGEGYSHELWTAQIAAFRERHLFVSYDRRGHGASADPFTGYSETAHAEDLRALLAHLGITDAHFVVNSRGGSVILRFLRQYPERVRSITFADATIPLVAIPEDSAFKPVIPALFGPPPSLAQALEGRERAKRSPFTRVAQAQPEVRAERMLDQYSPRVAMNPQRSDMASPQHIGPCNLRDHPDMSRMHLPVLLLVAEHTDVFFIAAAREAHRLWPDTRLHSLPGTDHLLMLEEAAEFNRIVLGFLAEVDGAIEARAQRQAPPVPEG